MSKLAERLRGDAMTLRAELRNSNDYVVPRGINDLIESAEALDAAEMALRAAREFLWDNWEGSQDAFDEIPAVQEIDAALARLEGK